MQEPSLKKAMTTLEFLSQDAETRRLYDARQKAIHDYVSDLAGAKEEGRQEGRQEERRVLAKSLLRMGLSLEQITQATGLPLDALEKLQADG